MNYCVVLAYYQQMVIYWLSHDHLRIRMDCFYMTMEQCSLLALSSQQPDQPARKRKVFGQWILYLVAYEDHWNQNLYRYSAYHGDYFVRIVVVSVTNTRLAVMFS